MFQSRDDIRRVYLTVWRKLQAGALLEPMEALIADVIGDHPEYHALLDDGEAAESREFTPEQGQTNPFLHMGMHIALREQADTDRPRGIAEHYRRLVSARGRQNAEHAMMECLGQILWQAQRDGVLPDESAYLDCLKKL